MTTSNSSDQASPTTDWERIETQLPPDWRQLADEMRLIRKRPAHMGTKVVDIGDVLRLVFHRAGTSSSLRKTTAQAHATHILSISAVALQKWFVKIGPYLAALLQRMVGGAAYAAEKWAGFDIIAGDATTVQRPGSKGTTARVHYALRLADLTARHIDVTDEHGGETARRFRAEPGELWLLDRGYSTPPGVVAITQRGGHILVRYNRGTLPLFDAKGQRIDVLALVRKTRDGGRTQEVPAFVHVGEDHIEGRLCWIRLPEDKAAEARARAQREANGACDAETLQAAEFVIVFTSVLKELTAEQVIELYRVRWQVELEFKRSKSICELDRLPNFRPDTIHSWICAKLLLKLVTVRIASQSGGFPPGADNVQVLPTLAPKATDASRYHRRAVVRHPAGVARRLRRAVACGAA